MEEGALEKVAAIRDSIEKSEGVDADQWARDQVALIMESRHLTEEEQREKDEREEEMLKNEQELNSGNHQNNLMVMVAILVALVILIIGFMIAA